MCMMKGWSTIQTSITAALCLLAPLSDRSVLLLTHVVVSVRARKGYPENGMPGWHCMLSVSVLGSSQMSAEQTMSHLCCSLAEP